MDRWHTEAPSPGVAAFIGSWQLKPSLSGLRASTLHTHTLPFGFDSGDARDRSSIGRGVLTTPPFVDPFCGPVDVQSTAQL